MTEQCPGQPQWVREVVDSSHAFTVDGEASEAILFESKDVKINSDGHALTHIRTVTKVFKTSEKTIGSLRELKSTNRTIDDLHGWRLTPNHDVQKLEKGDVAEFNLTEIRGYYDESRILVARFPSVSAGDLVAYEYEIRDEDWTCTHQRHSFQIQQPVMFSRFSIEAPEGWKIRTSEWNLDTVSFEKKGNRYTWSVHDLPFRPEEPLMPPWTFLERQVEVSVYDTSNHRTPRFSDWREVARWAGGICNPAMSVTDVIKEEDASLFPIASASIRTKLLVIGDYVRDKIRYVGVEVGKGRWEPRPSASTIADKYGDCKDKVTLMRALLAAVGIPSAIALANTSFYVHTGLPTPFQFNHAIIAVPTSTLDSTETLTGAISGKWLFFDPTNEANPIGALPVELQGNNVLVASEDDSVLVRLPYARPEENQRLYRATVDIGENSALHANIEIVDRGVFSNYVGYYIRTAPAEKQLESLRRFLTTSLRGYAISNYHAVQNGDSVCTSFQIDGAKGLQRSGNSIMLKPDLFQTVEFPVLTNPTRLYPIWFGGPRQVHTQIDYRLPDTWDIDAKTLPSGESSCKEVSQLSYHIRAGKHTLHLTSDRQNSGQVLGASDYVAVKAFSHEVRSYNQLTLILHAQ